MLSEFFLTNKGTSSPLVVWDTMEAFQDFQEESWLKKFPVSKTPPNNGNGYYEGSEGDRGGLYHKSVR